MSTPIAESAAEVDLELAEHSESATDIAARSPLELFWRRLKKDKLAKPL